jgi:hypothetical protein
MSGGDSAMLLISSDGEMGGGPGNEVDEIRLIRSPDGDSAAYSWSMRHFLTPEEPEYKYWNERRTECFEGRPPYQDISARVVVWFDERGA